MNFDLSDEQRMLVDGAQRYIRERYTLEERRATARTADGFSRQHWKTFAELGWLALPIPEECGGMGGTPADVALLMEQAGAGLVAEPLVDTAILCGTLLSQAETAQSAVDLLGEIASGERIVALAHLEQGGRNEFDTPVQTRAEQTSNGWKLNGVKHRAFHAPAADSLLVTARLDETSELALFVVDAHTPGMEIKAYEILDGTRAGDITFNDVELAEDALLLRGGLVAGALSTAFDHAILAISAAAVGSMDAVMAMTAEYLKTRVQYGQPLAKFQALQHRMAEMFVETDQARSIVYGALAAFEGGDASRRSRAISAAKSMVARACRFVTGQGIQLHGAIGTTEEYAVGHHYRAMLIYEYRFGDADFHLDRSAALSPKSV